MEPEIGQDGWQISMFGCFSSSFVMAGLYNESMFFTLIQKFKYL